MSVILQREGGQRLLLGCTCEYNPGYIGCPGLCTSVQCVGVTGWPHSAPCSWWLQISVSVSSFVYLILARVPQDTHCSLEHLNNGQDFHVGPETFYCIQPPVLVLENLHRDVARKLEGKHLAKGQW